ncbi:D-mandelate dehydrogenase-like protein [Byssothecium circinans]|uniref:D-mandelate dehydrogenase-like protein n=1 Tax=Byssothecium circinans TaxID=147558 RepID=A0A6A5U1G6_9PLEO|nr:D-mandelate dehydrogenase-like protein [Byssothecium circinans]
MSATPTPRDAGLPPPAVPAAPSSSSIQTPSPPNQIPASRSSDTTKPTILHLGDDIRWNHDLYAALRRTFNIERSYSMGRDEFKKALEEKRWGDFVGMYRPFWNTGGEMGNWDRELISLLPPSCRIYASAGAGFDWVDTRTLAAHNIIYCNSASACTESVVDIAIVHILSTYRALPWSFLAARSCDPLQFHDANQNIAAVTHNPNGTVLGIVGLGKIGFRLAVKAALAFEMRVWYHDVVRFEGREKELKDKGAGDVRYCPTLEELLGNSDCVVLCTPFSGSVLLSTEQFAQFKYGARLVNIARGKLVDEEALAVALDEGKVSAAGLDVHEHEPGVNQVLAIRRNVMVTCHTAGASVESHVGFERLGMENLLGWWREGRSGVISAVNLEWLVDDEGEEGEGK